MCVNCNKAKAAVFMGPGLSFEVREFPVAETPAGYGRSSLIASGVCGTDVHFHKGKLFVQPPTVIGHEFVGRLEDCDTVEAEKYGLHIGDNVIADIAVPCGECALCLAGDDANCVNMQVTNGGSIDTPPYLYGGYAQVNYTPLANLIPIPAQLDPAMVATFACPGPTAIHAFALARRANIDLNHINAAVVQGLGPVGCFALLYLKALGVKRLYAITAVKDPVREEMARRLGADEVLVLEEAGAAAVTELLQKENGGLGVDLCFEASGAPAAVPQGMEILRNRGVYLIPGQYSNSGGITIQPQMITFKALQIIGSSQYSMVDVREYLDFLCTHPECHGTIRALGSRYPVEQVNQAFADAEAGKNIKTLLVM